MDKGKETPQRQRCCTCDNEDTLPSSGEMQDSVFCREEHDLIEKSPGQCRDSPSDSQKVALVSVVPDRMQYGEGL